MVRRARPAAWILPCVLFAASPALAGERDHLGGFFLRLSGGLGYGSTSIESQRTDYEFSGGAGNINLAIGGGIASNLALHGTIWGWSVDGPDFKIDGETITSVRTDLSMGAVGGGLTYYIMPANVYLSGSLGFGSLTADGPDLEGESDTGFAADATLGKEWWVGGKWGLGIAGGVGFHSIGDDFVDSNWSGVNVDLRFTATLN